jgi:hypothetical protein
MWNYDHVDGSVHELFPAALAAVEELARRGDSGLDRATARLKQCMAALPSELPRFELADEPARELMRRGYIATLELAKLLDRIGETAEMVDDRLIGVTYQVLDFLEEWRPYISTQDAALHLVMLDGIPLADAVTILERSAADEDFCPICAALES